MLAVKDGTDRLHRRHQPPRYFAVGLFQPFGLCFGIVEFLGKARAVGVEPLHFLFGITVFGPEELAGLRMFYEWAATEELAPLQIPIRLAGPARAAADPKDNE